MTGKVYPKAVRGAFRRAKDGLAAVLLGAFFIGPWLRWDRGPDVTGQAVLLDLTGRRAHILGIEIWPQDLHLLAVLMILGVLALFATASLAGRVWCGFACPQTVFADIFLRIERWLEGDRAARMRLDAKPLSLDTAARKVAKHALWLAVSVAMAVTFTLYFVEAPDAVAAYLTGTAGPWMWTFVITLTASTYLLAGWVREQMCNSMCPWPRIQSTMLDDYSLVVTYGAARGDTRAPRRKSQTWEDRAAQGVGDCVDCRQCVQVCPIGIDIRAGINADCINCGLCIDACDPIMEGMGRPRGLIAFDSFAGQAAPAKAPTRLVRPKSVALAAGLAVGVVGLVAAFVQRDVLEVVAIQERAPLFVTLSDGSIRNAYTVKISNKTLEPRALDLRIDGGQDLDLRLVGEGMAEIDGSVMVDADRIAVLRLFVAAADPDTVAPDGLSLTVSDPGDDLHVTRRLPFAAPGR